VVECLYRVVCCGIVLFENVDVEVAKAFYDHLSDHEGHEAAFLVSELKWAPYDEAPLDA